ncbi:MAG: ATP-binding protein, partial [Clostridia bacterium]|nr:ATP-binding protein [Clostridia bacterium]
MKELSLNILDITENSVKAGAALTEILLDETEAELSVTIRDNGCGMTEEVLKGVTDPFYTTRTTRNVGLGLPLLKMAAEQTGGYMTVESKHKDKFPENCGTTVKAVFNKNHIDYTPLGDIISTLVTIIQGHPDTDFYFLHKKNEKCVELDTRQLRDILEDVPLNSYEVLSWVGGYLR